MIYFVDIVLKNFIVYEDKKKKCKDNHEKLILWCSSKTVYSLKIFHALLRMTCKIKDAQINRFLTKIDIQEKN